jgi:hypothetical protein
MISLSESDHGSDLLDFDSLPDAVNIGKPMRITATGSSLGGAQRNVFHSRHSGQGEASIGENALTSEDEAAYGHGDLTPNSERPHDTIMNVTGSSKGPSLFVHTSGSTEHISPGAVNHNGKRRHSDGLVGLNVDGFKRVMPTKKPESERTVIEADEFMMSVNQDLSSERKEAEPDGIYEWFAENFGFEHFNWVG